MRREVGALLLGLALGAATIAGAHAAQRAATESSRSGGEESRRDDSRAHWLVTTSGERIETSGPWRVEGRRVLFTAANGSLTSIRADQVDLAASREASEPAAPGDGVGDTPAKPLPAPAERRPPRLVLTEEDLPPMAVTAPNRSPEGQAEAEGPESGQSGQNTEGLAVVEWRNVAGTDEPLQIYGTVRNGGPRRQESVAVVVTVYDEGGNEVGNQPALLQTSTLNVGQSTAFRVSFPQLTRFERIEVEARTGS